MLIFLVIILLVATIVIYLVVAKHLKEVNSLRHTRDRHETINKITKSINAGMSSDKIIQIALKEIFTKFPHYRVSYATVSAEGMLSIKDCCTPANMPSIQGLNADLSVADDYLKALLELKVLAISDVLNDQLLIPLRAELMEGKTLAILDIPISHNDGFVGLFCMDADAVHVWSEHEVNMLIDTAGYLEIAISQAEHLSQQDEMALQMENYNKSLEAEVLERTKELQEAKHKAEQLSMTDELTKLPNRRAFFAMSEKLHSQAKRNNHTFSILMLDIDDFKKINDDYGHEGGDAALISMGKILLSTLRSADIVARIGGEEFVFLLTETDLEGAMQFAERLRVLVEDNSMSTANGIIRFTVSIGVAELSNKEDSLQATLSRADSALYSAKANGRNRVVSQPQIKP